MTLSFHNNLTTHTRRYKLNTCTGRTVKERLLLSISAPLRVPPERQHFTIQKSLMVRRAEKTPLCRYVLKTLAESLPLLSRPYKLEQDPKAVGPRQTNVLTLLPALTQAFRNWQSQSGTGLPPSPTYIVTSRRGRSSQPDFNLIVSNLRMRSPILLGLPRGSSSPSGQLC